MVITLMANSRLSWVLTINSEFSKRVDYSIRGQNEWDLSICFWWWNLYSKSIESWLVMVTEPTMSWAKGAQEDVQKEVNFEWKVLALNKSVIYLCLVKLEMNFDVNEKRWTQWSKFFDQNLYSFFSCRWTRLDFHVSRLLN